MTSPVPRGASRAGHRSAVEGRCPRCEYLSGASWPYALCPHNPKTLLNTSMLQPIEVEDRHV